MDHFPQNNFNVKRHNYGLRQNRYFYRQTGSIIIQIGICFLLNRRKNRSNIQTVK